jgi:hypothetical protein
MFRFLSILGLLCFSGYSFAEEPADEAVSLSYAAGGYDSNQHFLGGTETMSLVGYRGKLYAGVGYCMDRPRMFAMGGQPDPRSSAQILVLDKKSGAWRQEFAFDAKDGDGFMYTRAAVVGVAQFNKYDPNGNRLGIEGDNLIAILDGPKGAVYIQKAPGQWVDTKLPTKMLVRAFGVHYDPVHNVDQLFVGAGKGETGTTVGAIYSGVYDANADGLIRWEETPVFTGYLNRAKSMVECEGAFYFAAKPSIYRLNDRTQTWETLYSFPMSRFDASLYASGFRGLTCIDDPEGSGHKVLLAAFEGDSGDVLRINPITRSVITEVSLHQFLTQEWGGPLISPDIIAAYNYMLLINLSSGPTYFLSLLAYPPISTMANSAFFLTRSPGPPPSYKIHEVKPLTFPYPRSDRRLYSVRAIAVSPFPEDHGQVIYLGGYDGHFRPDHNTAWIYRMGVNTAIRGN